MGKPRETDVMLRPEDVLVERPERTLVQELDLMDRHMAAERQTTKEYFAQAVLGMCYQRWWAWRSKGEAPAKVEDYLRIMRKFPALRGKVLRHLLHRALTEMGGEE
jgi:hypothetical protein